MKYLTAEDEGRLRDALASIIICTCADFWAECNRKDPTCFRCSYADETELAEAIAPVIEDIILRERARVAASVILPKKGTW